jgi:hypothetical protein
MALVDDWSPSFTIADNQLRLRSPTRPLGRRTTNNGSTKPKPRARHPSNSLNASSESMSTAAPTSGPQIDPIPPTTIVDNRKSRSVKEKIVGPMTA